MDLSELIEILGGDESLIQTDLESRRRAALSWHPLDLKARQQSDSEGFAALPNNVVLPHAVVFPNDAAEVVAIVRWASGNKLLVVPVGGSSNLVGARGFASLPAHEKLDPERRPVHSDTLALDLSHLQDVSDLDEESLLVTAGAGVTLTTLEENLNRHGYTLGMMLQSANLATVGGCVATNAIGLLSGRYGRFADIVASLDVVRHGGGSMMRTLLSPSLGGGLAQKDLARFWVGYESWNNIITRATLRIRPLPEARAWASFRFAKFDDAVDATRLIYRTDARPACVVVLDKFAAPREAQITTNDGASLLFCVEGDEIVQTGVYQMAHAVCQKAGGNVLSVEVAESWHDNLQSQTSERFTASARVGMIGDVLAFWATWTQIKSLRQKVLATLSSHCERVSITLRHPDPTGASLEIAWEARVDSTDLTAASQIYESVNAAAYALCREAGGLVAHHWGVGRARSAAFEAERLAEGIDDE